MEDVEVKVRDDAGANVKATAQVDVLSYTVDTGIVEEIQAADIRIQSMQDV